MKGCVCTAGRARAHSLSLQPPITNPSRSSLPPPPPPKQALTVSNHPHLGQPLAGGLVAFRALSTVRAGGAACPWGAVGYYEIEVLHAGKGTRFGFCSLDWPAEEGPHATAGVGCDGLSWGVDGDGALKWHDGPSPFGGRWRAGDVVGLACDLRGDGSCGGGRMLVSLNGDFGLPYGAAFDLPATGLEGGLRPALTAESGLFRCNLGGRPFRHAPPSQEYRAMAAAGEAAAGGDGLSSLPSAYLAAGGGGGGAGGGSGGAAGAWLPEPGA